MDKYEELIKIFSDTLKEAQDYHIANIYQVGYVSVVGVCDLINLKSKTSIFIDEILDTPEKMAESLLKNWRWQWFYKNKQDMGIKDYDDIRDLDKSVPEELRGDYLCQLQELERKVDAILDKP
ncbi:MAG: hypothetical protein K2N34_13075 [Lachnospiraceae bacterium]|nr:hypothetical protein [Lachnospiraceae bacterium]